MSFAGRRLLRLPSLERSVFFDPDFSEENARRLHDISCAIRDVSPADPALPDDGTAGTLRPRIAFLHGVMPRSGTNYLQSLLELHPDVVTYPFEMREVPFLNVLPEARGLEARYFGFYDRNQTVMNDLELFAYTMGGFLRRIETSFPAGKLVLLKSPHTRMMRYFPYLFPKEKCLIVLRDGQRAVQSTLDTWPPRLLGRTFADVCREWSYGTEAALDAAKRMGTERCGLVKFEAAVADPERTARDQLRFLGLDEDRYPFERIATLPILGSSQASRQNGTVSWTPVEKPKDFDPSKRPVEWSRVRRMVFETIAGNMQKKAGYA